MSQAAPFLGMGVTLAIAVLVPLWMGHWVDRRYGTEPLGFLVGAVFGLLGAFYHFFKMYRAFTGPKR